MKARFLISYLIEKLKKMRLPLFEVIRQKYQVRNPPKREPLRQLAADETPCLFQGSERLPDILFFVDANVYLCMVQIVRHSNTGNGDKTDPGISRLDCEDLRDFFLDLIADAVCTFPFHR